MRFRRLLAAVGLLVMSTVGMFDQDTLVAQVGPPPSQSSALPQWAVEFFNAATTTTVVGRLT
ncbi:MAG: hypothetical protein JSW51_04135, partial [Gemmatimonadota bacterium]